MHAKNIGQFLLTDSGRTLKGVFRGVDGNAASGVGTKIKAALASIGADGWEYEVEFAKTCGVSLYDLGRVRDRFADHVVTISRSSKRAWAGSKALAAKMRDMV